MSNVLVTGGAGFLGKHLCRALSIAGHQVRVIDWHSNPEFPTTIADVRDAQALATLMPDCNVVFHLASLIEAGESVQQPQKYLDNNVMGTISVLESMRLHQVSTFIFSSSAAIYGDPLRTPIHEDDRTIPVNPYGMTKLAMEALLASYVKSFGFTGIALRYFNLYGPEEHHQPESHAIPRFIDQLIHDQPLSIYGDGGYVRDFVYISDVVDAHLQALELANREPHQYHYCNVSAGVGATVKEVADKLGVLLTKAPQFDWQPDRPGDPRVLLADPTKSHALLNWSAQVSLDEGLRHTTEYFSRFWQTI